MAMRLVQSGARADVPNDPLVTLSKGAILAVGIWIGFVVGVLVA